METKMKSLMVQTKANDVDSKGRVTVAVNRTGIEDSQGDISMPGSFDATLKQDILRMKWLYNHDVTQLLGVPIEGAEKDGDIIMIGQLNMDKQLCRDVYADYKLMAEYGRTLEHSVGVVAVRRDDNDRRKVLQWKMYEYSTLSFLGSNPCTYLVDLKSASHSQVRSAVEFLRKALEQPEYSDIKLKSLDMKLNLLLKSLNGARIVRCPECGYEFDYDSMEEHSFTEMVLDYARQYAEWIVSDTVYEHIAGMEPQIRSEVALVLDTVKALRLPINEKSISSVMSYVRCPCCWAKVFAPSTNALVSKSDKQSEKENSEDKDAEADKDNEETDSKESADGKDDQDQDEGEKKDKGFPGFLGRLSKKI